MKKNNFKKLLISLLLSSFSLYSFASTNLEEGIKKYKDASYEEAIELLNKAIQDEPDNPVPHQWLSKTYEATFDLQKSIEENNIFQKLKAKQIQNSKDKDIKIEKETIKIEDDKIEPFKIDIIDDNFLEKAINSRKNEDNSNYKYLSLDQINALFKTIPLDSDILARFSKNYEVKVYYSIANYQETLLFYKSKTSLLELDIELLKYNYSVEKDPDKKLVLEKQINDNIKDYKEYQNKLFDLIGEPILNNTDPLSFEYYQISNQEPKEYIRFLEEKKDVFKIAIGNVNKQVNNYKSIILPQEKELDNLVKKVDKNILLKPIEELSGFEFELVNKINNLKNKTRKDKLNMLFYSIELNILIDSYNKANDTIKKIEPSYNKIDDFELPKKEKIIEIERND